ncbi:MAG: hypothetical protein QOI83_1633 [Streptomycetaceae bacterium]|nr:hypothetical protein [Streptomycetaceae bacterium]
MVGGGVLGTCAVGALVATAVLVSGHSPKKEQTVAAANASASGQVSPGAASSTASATRSPSVSPSHSPSRSASATKSPPKSGQSPVQSSAAASRTAAPPDPLTMISDLGTDTAPLTASGLFPAKTLSIGGRTWTRSLTGTITPCWKATTGGLGNVLAASACRSLLRATYVSGDSAVTVAVAVFDHKAQADLARQHHQGQIQGLSAGGAKSFCTSAGCANTHAAVGRYGYFTVSGSAKAGGTAADPIATAAGPGLADYAYQRLLQRGKDAVAAAR